MLTTTAALSPLASALIPLGSVVVGGVLATGGQLVVERGRDERQREADAEARRRAIRTAVRLVVEELAESVALIEHAAETRRYWAGARQLPTNTWNNYRTDIAAALDASIDWKRVVEAYDSINNLNWTVGHRRATENDIAGHKKGFRVYPRTIFARSGRRFVGQSRSWRSASTCLRAHHA